MVIEIIEGMASTFIDHFLITSFLSSLILSVLYPVIKGYGKQILDAPVIDYYSTGRPAPSARQVIVVSIISLIAVWFIFAMRLPELVGMFIDLVFLIAVEFGIFMFLWQTHTRWLYNPQFRSSVNILAILMIITGIGGFFLFGALGALSINVFLLFLQGVIGGMIGMMVWTGPKL